MPTYFDVVQRCWRSEDATGAIVGYYPSEALALAALPSKAPAALTLADGTPVERRIDTDGAPLGLATEWRGTHISANAGDGFVSFGQEFDGRFHPSFDADLNAEAWAALKQLVFSGVVDEMIALAQGKPPLTAFEAAQRLAYEAGRASRRLLPPPDAA